MCSTLTKGTFSSRLLLSNQDKGCTPSVAHSLPLGPALLNLSILCIKWEKGVSLRNGSDVLKLCYPMRTPLGLGQIIIFFKNYSCSWITDMCMCGVRGCRDYVCWVWTVDRVWIFFCYPGGGHSNDKRGSQARPWTHKKHPKHVFLRLKFASLNKYSSGIWRPKTSIFFFKNPKQVIMQ